MIIITEQLEMRSVTISKNEAIENGTIAPSRQRKNYIWGKAHTDKFFVMGWNLFQGA